MTSSSFGQIPVSGSNTDIYGARVTPQGMVLDTQGFVISHTATARSGPWLLTARTSSLCGKSSRNGNDCDIYGARVTPEGTVLDSSGYRHFAGGKRPVVLPWL